MQAYSQVPVDGDKNRHINNAKLKLISAIRKNIVVWTFPCLHVTAVSMFSVSDSFFRFQ